MTLAKTKTWCTSVLPCPPAALTRMRLNKNFEDIYIVWNNYCFQSKWHQFCQSHPHFATSPMAPHWQILDHEFCQLKSKGDNFYDHAISRYQNALSLDHTPNEDIVVHTSLGQKDFQKSPHQCKCNQKSL